MVIEKMTQHIRYILLLAVVTILLPSCSTYTYMPTSSVEMEPPTIDDFPNRQVTFSITGNHPFKN